jgi:hypothetical protein
LCHINNVSILLIELLKINYLTKLKIMSEETTQSTENAAPAAEAGKRPVFLTVLCILSFIAAGFAIIGYIGVITVMGAASAAMGALEGMEGVTTTDVPGVGMTWAYIIVGLLATIVGLLGVIKMWKLKKQGFMMYAGATVVSLIMGIIYSGFGASIVGIIISGAFIAMYYMNTKHMS